MVNAVTKPRSVLTIQELRKQLIEIVKRDGTDPEADHCEADALLLNYIGDAKVTTAFSNIKKWYA